VFDEAEQIGATEPGDDDSDDAFVLPDTGLPEVDQPKPGKRGRKPLPAELARQRIEYDLSEEQKICPCCQNALHRMGEEVSEQLHMEVKASVLQHVRFKYACRACERDAEHTPIVTTPMPIQPLPGNRHAAGDVIIVRYADDSVLGFQYEGEARRFLRALQERMAYFGLQLHPDNTRLIRFGRFAAQQCRERGIRKPETFDFLGFTHCCSTRRSNGDFKIVRLTIKKRMRATLVSIRETLMRRRHEPVPVIGQWLRRVLRGYLNYHAVPDNMRRLAGFLQEIGRAWRHALLRRSQRRRLPWSRFARLLHKYLPPCRIVHPHPTQRFRVNTSGRSRMQ